MIENIKDKYLNNFYDKCRQSGLSVTPQRLAVYEALINDEKHPNPNTIYKRVISDFPMISFATVYKTLETFEQKKIISKVTTLHNTLRYDPITEQHHHIICTKCKKIFDLQSDKLNSISIPNQVTKNNVLINFSVHFNVICGECRTMK
jgi:Fur family transcriptional regulator, peroxide stress response regulator